jgi:hypothetical protein
MKKVGFVLDKNKARIIYYVELMKKLILLINQEVNLDHSLYFGAPGIGKSYALNLLKYMLYSNAGLISGPRFTLAGLTGGQKEVYYQDSSKKRNVPGLFSSQFFLFDEINNAQFLGDDKAVNLFKSVALAANGTSATVGGKEFPRIALIAGTANYDTEYLKHYENKVRKMYGNLKKSEARDSNKAKGMDQLTFFEQQMNEINVTDIPESFDYYAPMSRYEADTPKNLRLAVLKVRDESSNYLTNFDKPLMERFYWSILLHPKYNKMHVTRGEIDVFAHLETRKSEYTQRELLTNLYVPEFDSIILAEIDATKKKFNSPEIERAWGEQTQSFLKDLTKKYPVFFSMFERIGQVHVFALYSLSMLNGETGLSWESKRIYERLVSLSHTPISIDEFHHPDFEAFMYINESSTELLKIIENHPNVWLGNFVDISRKIVNSNLQRLINSDRIIKTGEYTYIIQVQKFEEVKHDEILETRDTVDWKNLT